MSKKNINKFTDFLYARPSFLEGLARVIDFGNILQEYNTSSTPEVADERAIRADWNAIGDDMYKVLENMPIKRKSL
jgi:hypothetical protein